MTTFMPNDRPATAAGWLVLIHHRQGPRFGGAFAVLPQTMVTSMDTRSVPPPGMVTPAPSIRVSVPEPPS